MQSKEDYIDSYLDTKIRDDRQVSQGTTYTYKPLSGWVRRFQVQGYPELHKKKILDLIFLK